MPMYIGRALLTSSSMPVQYRNCYYYFVDDTTVGDSLYSASCRSGWREFCTEGLLQQFAHLVMDWSPNFSLRDRHCNTELSPTEGCNSNWNPAWLCQTKASPADSSSSPVFAMYQLCGRAEKHHELRHSGHHHGILGGEQQRIFQTRLESEHSLAYAFFTSMRTDSATWSEIRTSIS